MNRLKKIFFDFILVIFLIALIINQFTFEINLNDNIYFTYGIFLAVLRSLFFYKFFKMSKSYCLLLFIIYFLITLTRSYDIINDLVITKYLTIANIISLLNFILMIYLFIKIRMLYLFNAIIYLIISIIISIEYIMDYVNIFEIMSIIVFLTIFLVNRRAKNDKK